VPDQTHANLGPDRGHCRAAAGTGAGGHGRLPRGLAGAMRQCVAGEAFTQPLNDIRTVITSLTESNRVVLNDDELAKVTEALELFKSIRQKPILGYAEPECAICLDEVDGQNVFFYKCAHCVCIDCGEMCPICRAVQTEVSNS
jgi:hypothetical protein